jgi:hypothetical protein
MIRPSIPIAGTMKSALDRRITLALALASVSSCQPDLGANDGLVTRPTILAVKAEPPEAKPGTSATYSALVAWPQGAAPEATVLWRFCTAPEPLTTDNAVAPACFDGASLVAAGSGAATMAATAFNACSVFGPETASEGARPPDPDETGGYYQPLRADLAGADPTFYLARLLCGLGSAPADVVAQYAQQYVPNANPRLSPLGATLAGKSVSLSGLRVAASATLALEASWPPSDAETYAYFDPGTQTLGTKREAMRVAWHASGGTFATESTGRSETDPATSTDDTWTAPREGGKVTLSIVLRDSRGGTDFASYEVTVTP